MRYKEHMRSLQNKDDKSALSQHVREAHADCDNRDVKFTTDIIQQCSTPIETRLTEAKTIDRLRPSLNRRHEQGGDRAPARTAHSP